MWCYTFYACIKDRLSLKMKIANSKSSDFYLFKNVNPLFFSFAIITVFLLLHFLYFLCFLRFLCFYYCTFILHLLVFSVLSVLLLLYFCMNGVSSCPSSCACMLFEFSPVFIYVSRVEFGCLARYM